MPKFLYVYHGGKMPETEAEGAKVIAAWGAWLGSLGESVIDGGNPVGPSKTVRSNGSVSNDGGANPASGYSLIDAAGIEDALAKAKGCPILEAGGTVEVCEAIEIQ